jgi:hypothetical protein
MNDIISILVCNNQKVLDHKLRDGKKSENAYCYWEMSRFPKRILDRVFPESSGMGVVSESAKAPGFGWYAEDDIDIPEDLEIRLYFAVKGQVLGYFICRAIGERHGIYELRFHSEDWNPIKPVAIKPSQGFRYFTEEKQ